MKSLDWEEFKKILNKVNSEHKVKLIPVLEEKGRYECEEKGKRIRSIIPSIHMDDNTIRMISFLDITGVRTTFHYNEDSEFSTFFEHINNWLDGK